MIASTLEDMLEQGFTRRMAQSYLKALEWERECGLFDADALAWAHERGFRAESLSGYDLLEHRLEDYLSDYDYARLWPLNSWQRLWINDKLTLKYLLAGTDMDRYLPAYYYYTSPDSAGGIPAPAAAATAAPAAAPGRLVPLSDSEMDPTIRGFLAQLKRVGAFACKPCNGEGASGFHELAYTQGAWQVDGEEVGRMGVEQFVASHSNYVFTELIRPASQLARVSPAIHTLRLLVLNPDGARPSPVANYLRFAVKAGTQGTKANYRAPIDESMCSYNCTVDFATGRIGGARLVYANRTRMVERHPDSEVQAEGPMPQWDETLEMAGKVARRLGPLEYLGFDVGVTDEGPRIMEINSHSGLPYLQLFTPLMAQPETGAFFRERMAALDALTSEQKARRNAVAR